MTSLNSDPVAAADRHQDRAALCRDEMEFFSGCSHAAVRVQMPAGKAGFDPRDLVGPASSNMPHRLRRVR